MKHNEVFLKHILDEIEFIQKEMESLDYEGFIKSEIHTRAFSRSLEIIGEAVKNLSNSFRTIHTEVDWRRISGMRDKIIHEYFGIDYEIVWDVIKNKLPQLKKQIEPILKEIKK